MMENKQLICDLLCKALQQTSDQDGLEHLDYDPQTEIVTARWSGDISKRINVATDSGIAGDLEPNDSVRAAVSAVFDEGVQVIDEPVLFYYNPDLTDCRWHETQEFVMEVGRHKFFKECVDEEKENRTE